MRKLLTAATQSITALMVTFLVTTTALTPTSAPVDKPDAPSTQTVADRLLRQHDCSTGRTDYIPGHAVVSTDLRGPRLVHAGVGFAITFGPDDRMGTGDERPGVNYGFCR